MLEPSHCETCGWPTLPYERCCSRCSSTPSVIGDVAFIVFCALSAWLLCMSVAN